MLHTHTHKHKHTHTHTHTQWTKHLTQMGKTSKAYKNLAVEHEGRHHSGSQGIAKS